MLSLSALVLATVLGAPTGPAPAPRAEAAEGPRDPFAAVDPGAARAVPMPHPGGELRDPFRPDPSRRPVAIASPRTSPLRDPFATNPARRPRAVPMRATGEVRSPFVGERRERPPAPAPVRTHSPAGELVDPFARAR